MLTDADINEVLDILDQHYYGMGVPSGHEALGILISDFFDGYLDNALDEWGVSKHEFHSVIFWLLAKRFLDNKTMWKSPMSF